jgi:hypothetical protein
MSWKEIFGFGKQKETDKVNYETAMALGFTQEALNIIKQSSNNSYQQLSVTSIEDDSEVKVDGLVFNTTEQQGYGLVWKLQASLVPLEFLVYICDQDMGVRKSSWKIAVIKGKDQFDILKVQQTNGINYDIENEDVISTLREWARRYPFTIIGAGFDWCELSFTSLPIGEEMESFAEEIYEFSPDIVDQGAGSVEALIEEINETKKLHLWWD